jgi:hypothetical protein
VVIRANNEWALKAGGRKDHLVVNIDVSQLANFHQIDPLTRDVKLNSLLELFLIFDFFDGVTLAASMN